MITRLESHCWLFSDFNVERGGIVQVGRSKRCDGRGHALQTHIIGYAYQERAWSDRPPSSTAGTARSPDGSQLKNLRELAPQIAACELPTQFEVGLDLLIGGLECILRPGSVTSDEKTSLE
jgi:hypothetical protein